LPALQADQFGLAQQLFTDLVAATAAASFKVHGVLLLIQ